MRIDHFISMRFFEAFKILIGKQNIYTTENRKTILPFLLIFPQSDGFSAKQKIYLRICVDS